MYKTLQRTKNSMTADTAWIRNERFNVQFMLKLNKDKNFLRKPNLRKAQNWLRPLKNSEVEHCSLSKNFALLHV